MQTYPFQVPSGINIIPDISGNNSLGTLSNPFNIVASNNFKMISPSEIACSGYAGAGSTNTFIERFVGTKYNRGTAITYVSNSVSGDSFVINENGFYFAQFGHAGTATGAISLTKNSILTPTSVPALNTLSISLANPYATTSFMGSLISGDTIRCNIDQVSVASNAENFIICKIF